MTTPVHQAVDRVSNYQKRPVTPAGAAGDCACGWDAVAGRVLRATSPIILLDCQPAVLQRDVAELIRRVRPDHVIDTRSAMLSAAAVNALVEPELTLDPVFGRISRLELRDFFDAARLAVSRTQIEALHGRVLVHGPGAALFSDRGHLVLAEVPRWETQLRQRAHLVVNLGLDNADERPALQYKRSFFIDWRIWDRHKRSLWDRVDALVDTTRADDPALVEAAVMWAALQAVARRPFRVVPYFDPAPWGGQWMKNVCDLDRSVPNWGWCFDCVPEENSLLLGFGDRVFETPSTNLVFREPDALLGVAVHGRFGAEFPIRFDFLDTMGGGNLSLQVHPLTEYIRRHFEMGYTQDESYYILDAEADATVYLGVREGVDREAMATDLRRAQHGDFPFPADAYVNRLPAARHDHFLIPAGTIHCSGANSMVLEISATPYIFTFKLWDWDRLGLDGLPRPIHLDHGLANIQWERDSTFVREQLAGVVLDIARGDGWREERTGLHEAEFIETRRHWFVGSVPHDTRGGVNVLNLVQGDAALVESPDEAFPPFEVHFAETFIVPAAVGRYTIRPLAAGQEHATLKAFVRTSSWT